MTEKKFSSDESNQNDIPEIPNVPTLNLDEAIDAKQNVITDACKVVDDILLICEDEPGKLVSDEMKNALELIRQYDMQLWAAYRVKVKEAKPSAVPITDIFIKPDRENPVEGEANAAGELIRLTQDNGALFYDPDNEKAFVTAKINEVDTTLSIDSKSFIEWISYEYFSSTGKSASETAIKQARHTLSGIAKYSKQCERSYLRVANHEDAIYIFLADEHLRAVEVKPTGWRVVDNPPVKFWKPATMQSLPEPRNDGNLNALWRFLNIQKEDRPLVLAWILESFRINTPKPVLGLCGTQGSAKSSTQNKIRQLVDNNSVNLRGAPKSVQDVYVSAGCNWLISYENISHLSSQMQDAFCTLATGGGFAARTLYSDTEETVIDAKRPIIINGIPNVVTAQDLTERTICLELPRIEYKEETELEHDWQREKPFVFGALLDLFVNTLKQFPKVKLVNPPRMADFTKLGEAMMLAQGHTSGEFTKLYRENLNEGIGRAMESSPAAMAVLEMVETSRIQSRKVFHGTVKNLLDKLTEYKRDNENWPRTPRGLSEILKRQSPALAAFGVDIVLGKKKERIGDSQGFPVTVIKNNAGNVGNVGNNVLKDSVKEKNFSCIEAEVF